MQITEEQRQRAEINRLAALEKRKAYIINQQQQQQQHQNPWRLFKCRKLSPGPSSITCTTNPPLFNRVNPDLDTHLPQTFRLRFEICSPDSFSITPEAIKGFPYPGEEKCLYTLKSCLSNVNRQWNLVIHKSKAVEGPVCIILSQIVEAKELPEHFTDEKVDEFIRMLPRKLLDALLPFQLDGLRFGLRRGGRCLIADEMGLGKTLQAIAIAGCFINEGPILVVCPAILRFSWAEELERWMPFCLPSEIHLVFGHRNNPVHLTRCPKVVVISYTMLHHLRKAMLEQEWALLIVDESHHVIIGHMTFFIRLICYGLVCWGRTSMILRKLLVFVRVHALMKQKVFRLVAINAAEAINSENVDGSDASGGCCKSKKLSYQELGIAKLSGFCEWLSIHPLISDGVAKLDANHSAQKMIIFAHHLKVLDGVQDIFSRNLYARKELVLSALMESDRQNAVSSFQSSDKACTCSFVVALCICFATIWHSTYSFARDLGFQFFFGVPSL
ncbi:DNA ANNEALING HELICASE AND ENDONUCLEASE ZRANB3 FAMILY MEMBER [Salix koriyanagi]|uniref:DNA ANNEALING HELICASE AND ENDONUCLEASE ZRANB3 FAMILY MEMBER n=1 Tax=Salix koriyanagi TaxID=2511006 RepID=A0A9Q0W9D0_9ROSI|nr:DNA ANNEALING HELICASE AND ENDONUCLEASE ZRANB3 FAMILY MEMBER [Salix koriyanagi]